MRTEQYIEKKLEEWNEEERQRFLHAYDGGSWDTVYDMTEDLTGGQYARQITLAELVYELKRGKTATLLMAIPSPIVPAPGGV